MRGWYNMASDKAINWPRSVEGILCSSQGPGGMSRAVTRTRCQAGSITMGKLGRRRDRSQGRTQSQRTETAWPDMACLLFTLSHRPHTCYADKCMQGFPDIICPAFGSFLPYPAPIWIQINTNIQLYANMYAHAHTVILALSSFSLSIVGIVSAVSPLIDVLQLGPVHPDYPYHPSQPLTGSQEG